MTTIKSILKNKGEKVYTVGIEENLLEAIKILNEKKIGALIVIKKENEIEGIISERDILREVDHDNGKVENVKIKKVMTKKEDIIVAHLKDDVDYAMNVMHKNKIRHLPIVDEKGNLKGIISIGDVLNCELRDSNEQNKYLNDYITGKYPV